MTNVIDGTSIKKAMQRVIERVMELREELNELDAAMGDGDTGITATKGVVGLKEYLSANPSTDDLGKFLYNAGIAINRTASSTLGTLAATALMRAGKEAQGLTRLDSEKIAEMLIAADKGIQDRGKAKPGDKTIVDALHPAAVAFSEAISNGQDLESASDSMLIAARAGRDAAIPLRSKIGRAAWVGERTENKLDPGTVLFVTVLEAILDT